MTVDQNKSTPVKKMPVEKLPAKPWYSGAVVLGGFYLIYFGYMAYSVDRLPQRVASHFNFAGQPDGWMSRSTHLLLMGLLGLILPSLLVGIALAIRRLPSRWINVPRREYWLAPERRADTAACMARFMVWYACLLLAFLTGLQAMIVQANHQTPVTFPNGVMFVMLGCFLAATGLWMWRMLRHFSGAAHAGE